MGYPRPTFDIADIVRAHRRELASAQYLSPVQKKVLTLIARCRTAALGGHLDVCPNCDHQVPAYNSCGNRNCPKCQALAQQKWIAARTRRILPIPHFHLVFTLPEALRPLARRHATVIYEALFHAVRELLLELGRTKLKARLGLTMVLHTWTRELGYHPHLHVIATAGGLSLDGTRFVHARKDYLFSIKVMGKLLRGKMLDALRGRYRSGIFPELDEWGFNALMGQLAKPSHWIVYAKAPFQRSTHVLSYLGRYTHRVGIANSRLVGVSNDSVTFTTKHGKTITLKPVTFLARFIQHVLPEGFHKIRHAGLYATPKSLKEAGLLLSPSHPQEPEPTESLDDQPKCPKCGTAMVTMPLPADPARAPPIKAG